MTAPRVFTIGPYPPPVHGMAMANMRVRDLLKEAGADTVTINIAASSLDRGLLTRLGRVCKVLRGLWRFAFSRPFRGTTLYTSVSAGLGQIYEVFFVSLARLHGMRIYLHHHSFAYLDRPHLATSLLMAAAGVESVHVVLSRGMEARLRKNYAAVRRVVPVSNAVFLFDMKGPQPAFRTSVKTIGFFSNISAEKGIFEFLDLIKAYETENLDIHAKLAGPFQDPETEEQVRNTLVHLRSIEYLGPKYGKEKIEFFSSIDLLIFPTRISHEAEPITILEGMMQGVPVVAYGRGSIPEIVRPTSGYVIDPSEAFVPKSLQKLKEWTAAPAKFQAMSRMAAEQFDETYKDSATRWSEVMREIVASSVNES